MKKWRIPTYTVICLSGLLCACVGGNSSPNKTLNNIAHQLGWSGCTLADAEKIELTGADTIEVGDSVSYQAALICKNGDSVDVSYDGNWSSGNYNILDVNNQSDKGKTTAKAIGNTTINYSYQGQRLSKPVAVVKSYCGSGANLISTTVEPANLRSLPVGGSVQLAMYASCSNGTRVDVTSSAQWQSSDQSIIKINNAQLSGIAKGSATISATLGANSVFAKEVTVDRILINSLDIYGESKIAKGASSQLLLRANYADGSVANVTNLAKYSVIYGGIIISESGLITATNSGSYEIQAELDGAHSIFDGEVTAAQMVAINLNNNNFTLTPYINSLATISATAVYSDGTLVTIPPEQLSCDMQSRADNLNQNGCSFQQISAKEGQNQIKVSYLPNPLLPITPVMISVSLSPIKGLELTAERKDIYFVGNEVKYQVNLVLQDNSKVNITKNIPLQTAVNGQVTPFSPTMPIVFDNTNQVLIFNKEIGSLTTYKVYAQIDKIKSNELSYSNVAINQQNIYDFNNALVNAFKSSILQAVKSSSWTPLRYSNNAVSEYPSVKGFFANNNFTTLQVESLSGDTFSKISSLFKTNLDYDVNDPNYQVQPVISRNLGNRADTIILTEFCNNTNVDQTFSTASISSSSTEGFSWGLGEKFGFDVAAKAGANILGFSGEVTQTTKFEISSSQNWNNSKTETFNMGNASIKVPPGKHAIVVSTVGNSDFFYKGKLPLKLTSSFPVVFRLNDTANKISAVGKAGLNDIYYAGTAADQYFEMAKSGTIYLDVKPQVLSTGGKTYRTVSHSVYFVNDSASGNLTCIYPTGTQNRLQTVAKSVSRTLPSQQLLQLKNTSDYNFLNRKPDLILPQQ